jgi:hypothetical protein
MFIETQSGIDLGIPRGILYYTTFAADRSIPTVAAAAFPNDYFASRAEAARGLFSSSGGNIYVDTIAGNSNQLITLLPGETIILAVTKIYSTGATVSDLRVYI